MDAVKMARILFLCAFFALSLQFCTATPKIQSVLVQKADRNADSTENIIITMKQRPAEVREQISMRSYVSKSERITDMVSGLQSLAESTQEPVIKMIKASKYMRDGTRIKSVWITNQIFVRNANLNLLSELSEHEDIVNIEKETPIHLDLPIDPRIQVNDDEMGEQEDEGGEFTTSDVSFDWNVALVQAPLVWAAGYNGSGVLIASIDTGVRATHEAVADSYKNDDYSWFDPYTNATKPYDDQGHGTHTLGTIVGAPDKKYAVGIAPGVKWIACKGFDPDGLGWPAEILKCAQFVLCPHHSDGSNADCSQAPRVVSNSWNSREETATWFNDMFDAWHEAGIIPVHSNGNYGTACCSVGSQAPRKVIAVGATNIDEELTFFSSVGPSYNGEVKPDISAPGQSIRSAYHLNDTVYATFSGTSMACPHIAGAVALLLSYDSSLDFDRIKAVLEASTEKNLTFSDVMCGGRLDSEFPNNHFGHGRLNAFAAYEELLRGDVTTETEETTTVGGASVLNSFVGFQLSIIVVIIANMQEQLI